MKNISILILPFFMITMKSSFANNATPLFLTIDTSKENEIKEDSLIEVLKKSTSLTIDEKNKTAGTLTKYGFRDLFKQYSYDPALPYSAQINPNAEVYMKDYLTSHSNHLLKMKPFAVPYFNLIDNIFKEYNLPTELKYLAVIESGLKTSATSIVGAAGPWQFMPATASSYGLSVTKSNDERRDYFKSTHAAAHFLLKLFTEFNDWLLVIAAYNGGPGRVYDAIRKSGSKDFWKLQYYLPLESRNHVKKFIATHYVMESNNNGFNNKSNQIKNIEFSSSEIKNTSALLISGKFISTVIAKYLSMGLNEFDKYNPMFDKNISTIGNCELKLPTDKMELFKNNKYAILNECVNLMLK